MTFFSAWSRNLHPPLSIQTFSCRLEQEKQYVDWYVTQGVIDFAVKNPGQHYIIGDEPDQYGMPTETYATYYHDAVLAILAVDETAKFSPAGFAEPNPKRTLNGTGYADLFLARYLNKYNKLPKVDEWRFHNFALNVAQDRIVDWLEEIDRLAEWSVVHDAKMYLGSWGFFGWKENIEFTVTLAKLNLLRDSRITGACWWSLEPWLETAHPLMEDNKLNSLGRTYFEVKEMTLEERVARLERIVGDWDTPPVLSTGGKPEALPNNRYDLKESDYQLHVALDELKGIDGKKGRLDIMQEEIDKSIKGEESEVPEGINEVPALRVKELYIGDKKIVV